MKTFRLADIPAALQWRHEPAEWSCSGEAVLSIVAPGMTDLFTDPGTGARTDCAPAALFEPPDGEFLLSARVEVAFGSTYDAGVLHVWRDEEQWAKLCFERSPQGQPMIVSVVTHGVSDDANSVPIEGGIVHLRVTQLARASAFHWSSDGVRWQFVRYFSLGAAAGLRVGFSSQSPTGPGCRSTFSQIRYRPGTLRDLRNGD